MPNHYFSEVEGERPVGIRAVNVRGTPITTFGLEFEEAPKSSNKSASEQKGTPSPPADPPLPGLIFGDDVGAGIMPADALVVLKEGGLNLTKDELSSIAKGDIDSEKLMGRLNRIEIEFLDDAVNKLLGQGNTLDEDKVFRLIQMIRKELSQGGEE